jgi:uncharacterized membrane protein YcaP (DUF421 family)
MNLLGDWLAVIQRGFELVFGSDVPLQPLALHQVAARGVLVYVIGMAIVRVGKSRLISRVTAVDVLLGFILGSVLGRGITGSASLSGTTVATAAIVAAHFFITNLAMRWSWFETQIKGHSRLVIDRGATLTQNLRISHISEDDLDEELRLRGIESRQQVKLAYKERNGEVSVIKERPEPRVVEVAVQQGVQTVRIVVE